MLTAPASVKRAQPVALEVHLTPGLATVVRLTVTGPDGAPRPWYAANLAIRDSQGHATFCPALNDPVGKWTFTATEIVSGATAVARLAVQR